MVKFCSECGFENKEDAQFCKKCGKPFDSLKNTAHKNQNNNKPKNNNVLIIAVAAVICVAIVAGAFVLMNNNSGDGTNILPSVGSNNNSSDVNNVSTNLDSNNDSQTQKSWKLIDTYTGDGSGTKSIPVPAGHIKIKLSAYPIKNYATNHLYVDGSNGESGGVDWGSTSDVETKSDSFEYSSNSEVEFTIDYYETVSWEVKVYQYC
ncbi:zinc-ribbon domain-containing protein [Methanobrevibacter sp.]|uniref:zinc ribbon domain-containing protein n=1 Tax=Methanobrevibacter sp. TaxID=66852 RepID=UPI0038904060